MARPFTPKVVTANALLSGRPVYLTASGAWSERMAEADLIEDEAHAAIRLLEADRQRDRVVGAGLADARAGPDGPEPAHRREAIRARGPGRHVFPQ